ncbi:hypothetical protein ACJQWK_06640 [Exserohilum turcicum]
MTKTWILVPFRIPQLIVDRLERRNRGANCGSAGSVLRALSNPCVVLDGVPMPPVVCRRNRRSQVSDVHDPTPFPDMLVMEQPLSMEMTVSQSMNITIELGDYVDTPASYG